MASHPDTRKPWVWAVSGADVDFMPGQIICVGAHTTLMLTMQVFAFNTLFGIIFAILSWATFSVRLSIHNTLIVLAYIAQTLPQLHRPLWGSPDAFHAVQSFRQVMKSATTVLPQGTDANAW